MDHLVSRLAGPLMAGAALGTALLGFGSGKIPGGDGG